MIFCFSHKLLSYLEIRIGFAKAPESKRARLLDAPATLLNRLLR